MHESKLWWWLYGCEKCLPVNSPKVAMEAKTVLWIKPEWSISETHTSYNPNLADISGCSKATQVV